MAENPQMPLLSSPHTCTARAEEAQPGALEDKAPCGGGSERGYGRVQHSYTDSSSQALV